MRIRSSKLVAMTLVLSIGMAVTSCRTTRSRKSTVDHSEGAVATEASMTRSSPSISMDGMVRNGLAFPTGDKSSSALMLEKIVPAEVNLNQSFSYYLKVQNLTGQNLEDVVVSDRIDPNFTIASTEPALAGSQGGVASWNLGKLGANDTATIKVTGQAAKVGTIASCASVTYTPRVCATINVVRAALQLTKRAPELVMICDEIPVEYVVTNTGTGTARDIVVTEDLPANLITESRRPVRFTLDELGPGKSHTFKVMMKASQKGSFAGMATAKAGGNLTASSTRTTTMVREPALTITKAGPDKTFLGRDVTYQITVKNVGDAVAKSTRIEDVIPSGAKFVSATQAGSASRGKVVWSLGDLPPQTERTVNVTLRADQPLSMKSTATASAICAAEVAAAASTELVGIPASLLEVVDLDDPIAVGEIETYEIRVTNQGSAPGSNITIVCTLEDTMEFVDTTGPSRGTHRNGQVVFAPLPTLAPKERAVWRVQVRAVREGSVRFKVSMTSDYIKRAVEETEATNFYK